MAFETLIEKDIDLSALGFGDNLLVEFDKDSCLLRVSVFEDCHYKDEVQVDLLAIMGYEDAEDFEPDPFSIEDRKRAYRRSKDRQKRNSEMKSMFYANGGGYTDWGWKDGVYQPVGDHVQYSKSSRRQRYWKNYSNRKIRRHDGEIQKGNAYRRVFDYKWEID